MKEIQFRRRSLIKEGTIGGKFCQEKTFDVQQCVCSSGKTYIYISNSMIFSIGKIDITGNNI